MKNFKIGKDLTEILLSNSEITNVIGDKVFPLVANAGTTFPFIVYRRSGYTPASNKDYTNETVQVELAILSENYIDSVQLADLVGTYLETKTTDSIDEIKVINSSEEFIDDTYIQKIYLEITLK